MLLLMTWPDCCQALISQHRNSVIQLTSSMARTRFVQFFRQHYSVLSNPGAYNLYQLYFASTAAGEQLTATYLLQNAQYKKTRPNTKYKK